MSLGGYKFSGFKCSRSSLTDLEWVLLCHKTRVKAFLSSNSLSQAGWGFDPSFTSGMYSFESFGNVIYSEDNLGYNLVSFFKHNEGDAYFSILTLGYYQAIANLANGCVTINTPSVTNNSYRLGNGGTMFCKVSKSQITPSNVLTRVSGELCMMPCGKLLQATNYNNGPTPSTWENSKYTYLGLSTVYSGFAIREGKIISFMGFSPSGTCISCYSANPFSLLFNDNDIYTQFAINVMKSENASNNERDNAFSISNLSSNFGVYALDCNGNILNSTSNPTLASRGVSYNAGSVEFSYVPYDALVVDGIFNPMYNNYGKGIIDIDFLAYNFTNQLALLYPPYRRVASGNYMCVSKYNASSFDPKPLNGLYTTSSGPKYFPSLFIGWDASNPEITSEDAWQVYNG